MYLCCTCVIAITKWHVPHAGNSATVAGDTFLPVDPSQLAAVQQATSHLVFPPGAHSELSAVLILNVM